MLIPIQCEYYALEGVGQLLRNIEMVKAHLNPDLERHHGDPRRCTTAAPSWPTRSPTDVRAHFGDKVLRTVIPRSVKVSEAPGYGMTILDYDPGSRGAMSYLDAELAESATRSARRWREEGKEGRTAEEETVDDPAEHARDQRSAAAGSHR